MSTGKQFDALIADTTPFALLSGRYAVLCELGDLDSIALEAHMGGTTWLAVPSLQVAPVVEGTGGGTLPVSFAADGMMTCDLPPGTYRLNVEGADTDPPATVIISRISS